MSGPIVYILQLAVHTVQRIWICRLGKYLMVSDGVSNVWDSVRGTYLTAWVHSFLEIWRKKLWSGTVTQTPFRPPYWGQVGSGGLGVRGQRFRGLPKDSPSVSQRPRAFKKCVSLGCLEWSVRHYHQNKCQPPSKRCGGGVQGVLGFLWSAPLLLIF